jgi:hypothetical protein
MEIFILAISIMLAGLKLLDKLHIDKRFLVMSKKGKKSLSKVWSF